MRTFLKRAMAGAMAASLVMSSTLAVSAADPAGTGTAGGTGGMEGIVDTSVYNAVLPTEDTNAYDYIVDPQGLIRKTNAVKYSGKEFGEGTVFFENVDGDISSYSNTSDAATITNKSSKNLSVKVTATATAGSEAGAAALATDKTFASDNENLEIYLGITDSVAGSTEKALTAAGAEMTAVLGAAPEGAYEYKYDETNGYSYALKDDISAFIFTDYSFQINGAANENAEWKADTAVPAVSITWDVDVTDDAATVETPEQDAAPSVSATAGTYSKANGVTITGVNLGAGASAANGISKVQVATASGSYVDLEAGNWSYNNGSLSVSGTWGGCNVGEKRNLKIIFADSASTQAVLEMTIAE